jgi:bacterioferritin-associated ferredoxin
MKNQFNFFITHTKEIQAGNGQTLKASFDIDSKKELINYATIESSGDSICLTGIVWPKFPIGLNQFLDSFENQSIDYRIHYLLFSFFVDYVGLKASSVSNNDICLCFGVKESTIINLIKNSDRPIALNEIINNTEATTACGKCLPSVLNLYFEKLNEKFFSTDETEEMYFSYRGMSYPELLIFIDDLIKEYIDDNDLTKNSIQIYKSFGRYINLKIIQVENVKKIHEDLQKLVFKRLGLLVFFFD